MQNFIIKWVGRIVDVDNFPKGIVFQCVDLVVQYLNEFKALVYGGYGNAIDYWTKTHPKVAAITDRVASQEPIAGDITVLNGLQGNPYGHIGVATGYSAGNMFEMLEQNGATGNGLGQGGDLIRKRMIPKSRIAGILRLKGAVTQPPVQQPIPAPTRVGHLHLPVEATRWRVYPLGVATKVGNEKGFILPAKFGGLDYDIIERPSPNVAIIETRDFGKVQIWIAPDTGAIVS